MWGPTVSRMNPMAALAQSLSSGIKKIFKVLGNGWAAVKVDNSMVVWDTMGTDYSSIMNQIANSLSSMSILSASAHSVSAMSTASDIEKVFSNSGAMALLRADGSIATVGDAVIGGDSSSIKSQLSAGVVDVVTTDYGFSAIRLDGSVVSWGDNGSHAGFTVISGPWRP